MVRRISKEPPQILKKYQSDDNKTELTRVTRAANERWIEVQWVSFLSILEAKKASTSIVSRETPKGVPSNLERERGGAMVQPKLLSHGGAAWIPNQKRPHFCLLISRPVARPKSCRRVDMAWRLDTVPRREKVASSANWASVCCVAPSGSRIPCRSPRDTAACVAVERASATSKNNTIRNPWFLWR